MLALDVVRLEAGLILLEVDYTSARHAMNAEQAYSPAEIGLGRLVDLDKGPYVGQRALAAEARAGGPARRLVGLELDWAGIDALHAAQDLPPVAPAAVSRAPVPVFDRAGRAGRPGDERRLEPDPQEADRPRVRAAGLRTTGQPPVRGVDRRGPPRPGRRDGRHAALPRPAAEARLTSSRRPAGARADARARSGADERERGDQLAERRLVHPGAGEGPRRRLARVDVDDIAAGCRGS